MTPRAADSISMLPSSCERTHAQPSDIPCKNVFHIANKMCISPIPGHSLTPYCADLVKSTWQNRQHLARQASDRPFDAANPPSSFIKGLSYIIQSVASSAHECTKLHEYTKHLKHYSKLIRRDVAVPAGLREPSSPNAARWRDHVKTAKTPQTPWLAWGQCCSRPRRSWLALATRWVAPGRTRHLA
jgi:hypothetical protein